MGFVVCGIIYVVAGGVIFCKGAGVEGVGEGGREGCGVSVVDSFSSMV